MNHQFCPCGTGRPYKSCCQSYHLGKSPEQAVLLMRSRYSAYALNLPLYIIETTHPQNPTYRRDKIKWKKEIESFSTQLTFKRLDVLMSEETGHEGTVCFVAYLQKGNQDLTFTEKSFFKKEEGRWFYLHGYVASGALSQELAERLNR